MNTGRPRVYIKIIFLAAFLTIGLTGALLVSASTIDGWIKTDEAGGPQIVIGANVVFLDATGNLVDSSVTDGLGYYSITVDPGTYDVYVFPPDFAHTSGYYHEGFEVFGDQTMGDWYVHYYATSISFTGIVYESTGLAGLDGCGVYLSDTEFFYYDETSGGGTYSITLPEAGDYEFDITGTAGNDDYYYPWQSVTAGGSKNVVLTSAAASASISGTITDSIYTTPYEDFWVIYTSTGDAKYGPYTAETDALGQYSLRAYPGNEYDIQVTPPEYLAAYEETETAYTTDVAASSTQKDYDIENPFPVSITVDDGTDIDTIHMADHNSVLDDGNYITLGTGDITVDLPDPMDVDYSGPRTAENEYEGNTVNVYSAFETRSITSPINTWELYFAPATVDVTFHGDDRLVGQSVDVRLLSPSYNEVMDAITDAKNGNTETLKNIIANDLQKVETTIAADGSLADPAQFIINDPGDYTVVITYEIEFPNPYVLYIYSVAPVEVLDYHIDVIPDYDPAAPELGVDVEVDITDVPTGTEFSYASLLIREDAYSMYADINTDGTVDGTTTDVQHQGTNPKALYRIASNGEILGIPYANYQDLLDYDLLNNELGNIYNLDEYSLGSSLNTDQTTGVTIGLDTDGFQGQFILTTIVWEHDTGNRIVAFDQQYITLGQQTTITIDSTNLPQPFSREVDVDYTIESTSAVTGAEVHVRVDVDGNIDVYTETVTLDLVSGTNAETYTLDTLAYIDGALARSGAAITITLELWHPIDGYITEDEVTDQLTQTSKDIMWERVLDVVGQWPFIDRTQKDWLWDNLILNVVGNWPFVPRAVP